MDKFPEIKTIGMISDTHNLLRPEAVNALQSSDLIIHAGDIGKQNIIKELENIVPVIVVRGNIDQAEWCRNVPLTQSISVGEVGIYVIHNLKELDLNILPANTKVVISGHSHKPIIQMKGDVLYLNPGSAGRRRFKLPISLAKLHINQANIRAEIIELAV